MLCKNTVSRCDTISSFRPSTVTNKLGFCVTGEYHRSSLSSKSAKSEANLDAKHIASEGKF